MFDDDRPLSLGGGFGGFDAGAPAKKPVLKPASKLAPAKPAPGKPLAKPALHAPAKPTKPGAKKQSTGRSSGKPGIARVGRKLYPKGQRQAARGRGRDTRGFDTGAPTTENYMFADHDGKHWAGNLSPDGSFNPVEPVYEGAVTWASGATPGHLYKMGPAPGFANQGDQGEYQADKGGGGGDSDATPAPQGQPGQGQQQGGDQGYQQPNQQQPLGLQAQPADQGANQLGAQPQIIPGAQAGDQPFAFAPGQLVLGSATPGPLVLGSDTPAPGLAADGTPLSLGAALGAQPLIASATPLVIADSGEAGEAGSVGQLGVVNITSNLYSSPRGGDFLGRLVIGTPVRFERSTRYATLVRFRGGAGWIPRFNVDWDW